MNPDKYNRKSWDLLVDKKDRWTQPVSSEEVELARNGVLNIVLTPIKNIPEQWFPKSLKGKSVLCLASGGGQQSSLLAAAGAIVTVLDNSPNQLKQDEFVAKREGLSIALELGDMKDLSRFNNETFDLIINPVSNCFIENVLPVWNETHRVLKRGGNLLAGFTNPITYIFDLRSWNEGELKVRHSIPYSDLRDLSEEELESFVTNGGNPVCFGHSLEDQIQGQINAGFVIDGFYEDKSDTSPLNPYINSFIATKATKVE